MTNLEVAKPITLPCGLTLTNRLAKAAMGEGWSDKDNLPREVLFRTYSSWANGGWGMVLTGNVQVDVAYLGTSGDNAVNEAISQDRLSESWTKWATAAAGKSGTPVIMQLNHPGRQAIPSAGRGYLAKTIAPTAIPLQLGVGFIAKVLSALIFGEPREMTRGDIERVIQQFTQGAKLAHEAGFSGVQIHAAHGYLLAQFLSATTNQRVDRYGGTSENRGRIVVEIITAIRRVVPSHFCVGIKFNSVDVQNPQELADCMEQLERICASGIDFLEISGGSYENPSMVTGDNHNTSQKTERLKAREAFFLEFAKSIRNKVQHIPLMVTGGFRSRIVMETAVKEGTCDLIGIARPAALNPFLPKNIILNEEVSDSDAKLHTNSVPASWLCKALGIKALAGSAEVLWYGEQIRRLSGIETSKVL